MDEMVRDNERYIKEKEEEMDKARKYQD